MTDPSGFPVPYHLGSARSLPAVVQVVLELAALTPDRTFRIREVAALMARRHPEIAVATVRHCVSHRLCAADAPTQVKRVSRGVYRILAEERPDEPRRPLSA